MYILSAGLRAIYGSTSRVVASLRALSVPDPWDGSGRWDGSGTSLLRMRGTDLVGGTDLVLTGLLRPCGPSLRPCVHLPKIVTSRRGDADARAVIGPLKRQTSFPAFHFSKCRNPPTVVAMNCIASRKPDAEL